MAWGLEPLCLQRSHPRLPAYKAICQKFKMQVEFVSEKDFFSFSLLSKLSSVLLFLFKDKKKSNRGEGFI